MTDKGCGNLQDGVVRWGPSSLQLGLDNCQPAQRGLENNTEEVGGCCQTDKNLERG